MTEVFFIYLEAPMQKIPVKKLETQTDIHRILKEVHFGAPPEIGVYTLKVKEGGYALFAPTSPALIGVPTLEKRAWILSHGADIEEKEDFEK